MLNLEEISAAVGSQSRYWNCLLRIRLNSPFEPLELRSAMMNLMGHHDLAIRFASGQAMGTNGLSGRQSSADVQIMHIISLMRPLPDGRFRKGMARLWTNNAYISINDRAGIQVAARSSRHDACNAV